MGLITLVVGLFLVGGEGHIVLKLSKYALGEPVQLYGNPLQRFMYSQKGKQRPAASSSSIAGAM